VFDVNNLVLNYYILICKFGSKDWMLLQNYKKSWSLIFNKSNVLKKKQTNKEKKNIITINSVLWGDT